MVFRPLASGETHGPQHRGARQAQDTGAHSKGVNARASAASPSHDAVATPAAQRGRHEGFAGQAPGPSSDPR
eukprot:1833033-Alexandrium_andersonii.AAC.1